MKANHLLNDFSLILALIKTIFISLFLSSEIIVGQISDSAKIADEGHLFDVQRVDENDDSSKTQPFFVTNKKLFFLSDESGYWNLRSCDLSFEQKELKSENVYQIEADCCGPPWVTGKKNFSVINSCEVAISVVELCQWKLHLVNLEQKTEKIIHAQLGSLDDIVSSEQYLFYLASDEKNYPGI